MAAVSCEELWPGRAGQDDIDRRLGKTRVFEVYTDDPADDADDAAAHPDVPRNGDEHPTNANLTMTRIRADNGEEDPLRWLIVCEYTSDLPAEQAKEAGGYNTTTGAAQENPGKSGGGPSDRADNPIDRPPTVRVDWEESEEPFEFDANGDLVVNSAGYPFDPPAMTKVRRRVITITKNYATTDAVLGFDRQDQYTDVINSVAWAGRAARTCKICPAGLEYAFENGVSYGRMTWRIVVQVRGRTWKRQLVDRGYFDDLGARIETVQGSGQYPEEPSLLDGSGSPLAAGFPPVVLDFDEFGEEDFSTLGI